MGFSLTDNTDYNQLNSDSTFNFGLFSYGVGVRFINVIYPDGSNKIFVQPNYIIYFPNNTSGIFNTGIHGNGDSFQFISYQQGTYTVQIVSIPYCSQNNSPLNFQIGDLTVSSAGTGYLQIYRAKVNNPSNVVTDTSQYDPVFLSYGFKLFNVFVFSSEFDIPSDYVSSQTYTQNCSSDSLECILSNLSSGLCCSCCEDIFKNSNSVSILRATFLVAELQYIQQNSYGFNLLNIQGGNVNANLTYIGQISRNIQQNYIQQNYIQPVINLDSFLEKSCEYSNVLSKLCQCAKLEKPCEPCDGSNTTPEIVSQSDITGFINNLFINLNVPRLLNQETLYGKKLCCVDRKQFLALFIANVIYKSGVSITTDSFNCLSDTINEPSSSSNNNDFSIVNSSNTDFINNTGDTLVYNSK